MTETDQARRFLRLLFEQKRESDHVLIWKLHGRHSRFFLNIDQAAEYAAAESRDVYFGVGLSPTDNGPAARCLAENIAGIAGVWCDLDIFHPIAHSKKNLPPDEKAALKILSQIAYRATFIIHSGYGLQAWWLFKELWIFETPEERTRGAQLAQKWNQYIRAAAQRLGWEADSVGDLARVLRIPGTINGKIPDEPKPVRIKWGKQERRYNPSELEELVGTIELPAALAGNGDTAGAAGDWSRTSDTGLVIDPDRQPPIEMYQELRRKSRRFVLTIEHQRTDLADQSVSSYDMALAAIAVRHSWKDQDIADLLVMHQRRYPLMSDGSVRGIKGVRDRPKYFTNTIAKARLAATPDARVQRLKDRSQTNGHQPPPAPSPESASGSAPAAAGDTTSSNAPSEAPPFNVLDDLSAIFRVKILRVLKQLSDPPLYTIETERGNVAIGEVQNLIEQRALRNRLANIGVYLTKRKEDEWEPIATALLESVTAVETTADATYHGAARAWIRDYLMETVIVDSIEEADRGGNPFVKEGALYLSSANLRKFLIMNNGERQLTARELTDALRGIGAAPVTMFLQTGEQRTSRSLWKLAGAPDEYR